MKVLICGGRDLNEELVCTWLENNFLTLFPDCTTIVHGNAKGGDKGAGKFCAKIGFPVEVHKAEWHKYGPSAGPIRNEKMLLESNAEIILAFPGSRGTRHMINTGKKHNRIVYEVPMDMEPYIDCFED